MKENHSKLVAVIGTVMIIALIGIVFFYWYNNKHYVATEDARVTGDLVKVSPKISGELLEFTIEEGDTVIKEQILGRVEPGTLSDNHIEQSVIRAPIDGIVVKNQGKVGEYESAGESLAMLVDPAHLYITANIEETKLGRVRPGQAVDIVIDQFSETRFTGKVKYIGQAANSCFSLLPTSTSGTFTKVVQRIPVRIEFDKCCSNLIPGTNAVVKIRVN